MYILIKHEEGCWTKVLSKENNLDQLVAELVSEVEIAVKRAGYDFDSTIDDGDDYRINRPTDKPVYFGEAIASASFDTDDASIDWVICNLDAPKRPERHYMYRVYRVILGSNGDVLNAGFISKEYETADKARDAARSIAAASANYQQALLNISGDDKNSAEFIEGCHSDDSDFSVRKTENGLAMYEKYYIEEYAVSEVK